MKCILVITRDQCLLGEVSKSNQQSRMRMHPMVPELVPAGALNLMPKLHILLLLPADRTQSVPEIT